MTLSFSVNILIHFVTTNKQMFKLEGQHYMYIYESRFMLLVGMQSNFHTAIMEISLEAPQINLEMPIPGHIPGELHILP